MAVMVIMVAWSVYEREHSGGRPWELVAAVPFSTVIKLEYDPKEERKHMGIHKAENNGYGKLNKLILTILANTCSIGWQYSPTMLNGASYS